MLYFARHGQTDFNLCGITERDISINSNGQAQAGSVKLNVDIVVISNLRRTEQTLSHSV